MSDTGLWLTLWIASGAFLGGTFTPLLAENKRFDEWLVTLIGTVAGAIGNVIALVPLWGLLATQRGTARTAPRWQADDLRLADLAALPAGEAAISPLALLDPLKAALWPKPRADGHSHRATYVSVAVALAVITIIEVLLSVLELGFPVTGPLVMLSTVKVLLVAGVFMHLAYDSRWYTALFAIVLPFAALILAVLALA